MPVSGTSGFSSVVTIGAEVNAAPKPIVIMIFPINLHTLLDRRRGRKTLYDGRNNSGRKFEF